MFEVLNNKVSIVMKYQKEEDGMAWDENQKMCKMTDQAMICSSSSLAGT